MAKSTSGCASPNGNVHDAGRARRVLKGSDVNREGFSESEFQERVFFKLPYLVILVEETTMNTLSAIVTRSIITARVAHGAVRENLHVHLPGLKDITH
jgi:hypothetical protein